MDIQIPKLRIITEQRFWNLARRKCLTLVEFLPPIIVLITMAISWELWVHFGNVPSYILPGPLSVIKRLFSDPSYFAYHGSITLWESMAGFALGSATAFIGATLMIHSKILERSLFPLAILIKVTPIIAIAPLFVIWFGFGSFPKVLIAAIIAFFPTLINAIVGFRSVQFDTLDFFHSIQASKKEVFLRLRIPSSLPYLFAAFKISIPLSIIGAVVGEWFSGDKGLGSVIIIAHNNLYMDTLLSAVLVLAIMGIVLNMIVSHVERRMLFWHESSHINR